MILMIDNYDSFTYNLVQYLAELGADLKVIRNDDKTVDEIIKMKPKGIVLSPGPGRAENAGVMQDLLSTMDKNIPVFGVCLGYQAIAQVHGAKIDYAPTLMHGKTSQIFHDNSAMFKDIPSPFTATRYHSLVVDEKSLPDDFIITARTDDNVLMAIQHKSFPMFGVQFHPESILTTEGMKILKNFLRFIK
jgi:anthranilate synthase/aminodeoxychorismate synthase-like glutamine amidotransferase